MELNIEISESFSSRRNGIRVNQSAILWQRETTCVQGLSGDVGLPKS